MEDCGSMIEMALKAPMRITEMRTTVENIGTRMSSSLLSDWLATFCAQAMGIATRKKIATLWAIEQRKSPLVTAKLSQSMEAR